jgi:hypothetical protein
VLVSCVTGSLIIGAGSAAYANASVPDARSKVPLRPESRSDCTDYLETCGYVVTKTRYTICGLASLPFPCQQVRIATCTAALLTTGVGGLVSSIACILATAT